MFVERDDDVDERFRCFIIGACCGCGCFALSFAITARGSSAVATIWREKAHQQIRDEFLIPHDFHAIGKRVLVVHDKDVILRLDAQIPRALDELFPSYIAKPVCVADTQTENLQMVTERGVCEARDCGRKEHCFIVGVCDQEEDAAGGEGREGQRGEGGVDVEEGD